MGYAACLTLLVGMLLQRTLLVSMLQLCYRSKQCQLASAKSIKNPDVRQHNPDLLGADE